MSGPCQNGGSCVSVYEKNSFLCTCVKGYTGSTCQTGKTTITLKQSSILFLISRLKDVRAKMFQSTDFFLNFHNRQIMS